VGRVAGSAYARVLSPHLAALLTDHVTLLFLEFELGSRLAEEIVSRTSPEEPFNKGGCQCQKASAYPRG